MLGRRSSVTVHVTVRRLGANSLGCVAEYSSTLTPAPLLFFRAPEVPILLPQVHVRLISVIRVLFDDV